MSIILSGKTCAGKDTILKELVKLGIEPIISYTTRDIRDNEIDGIQYHFITDKEFSEKEKQGYFIETTQYNTVNGIKKYGSSKEDFLTNSLYKAAILNPDGVRVIKSIREIDPIVFYIECADSTIKERLIKRGDNLEEAKRRLQADEKDFLEFEKEADYLISKCEDVPAKYIAKSIYNTYMRLNGGMDF